MKIAIVAQPGDVVPPVKGGSLAIWADELARRLAVHHQVAVYSRQAPGRPDAESREGVQHRRSSTAADERWTGRIRRLERLLGMDLFHRYHYFGASYYKRYAADVAAAIARDGADVIILVNFSQFAPRLRRANPGARIVLVMQCDWLIELDPQVVLPRLEQVDAICGCSRYIAEGVARRYPAHADKCHALYNASNPEVFQQPVSTEQLRDSLDLAGRRVISFVGRVTPEKGVHVLLEAMQQVVAREPQALLLVVGGLTGQSANPPSPRWVFHRDPAFGRFEAMKADYPGHLRRLAAACGDAVRLVGNVSHYELAGYYAVADLFVHPSVWPEPFGMILTEAMACERAVVSTRTGGIPEVVLDGETGLLAEPDDPESLAEAILELLADDARRQEMGRRGKQRVLGEFTWDNTVARLEQILGAIGAGEIAA